MKARKDVARRETNRMNYEYKIEMREEEGDTQMMMIVCMENNRHCVKGMYKIVVIKVASILLERYLLLQFNSMCDKCYFLWFKLIQSEAIHPESTTI